MNGRRIPARKGPEVAMPRTVPRLRRNHREIATGQVMVWDVPLAPMDASMKKP